MEMRTNLIVVAALVIGLALGVTFGKYLVFKSCPTKCPDGQVMITGVGCFTPGVYYTDTTNRFK